MKRLLAFLLAVTLALPVSAQQSIKSFLGVQGKQVGEVVSLLYRGFSYTGPDGSVWLATNGRPLAYSATYSNLLTDAPYLITSASLLPGPFLNDRWSQFPMSGIIGPSSGTWLTVGSNGILSGTYTSTNGGVSWTQRTTPVAGKGWIGLWDGTNYVLYALSTGATGVQESTDGINWTARTAISISSAGDFLFNGSIYLLVPSSGTVGATSSDRTTWTSRTLTATPSFNNSAPGIGNATWNAGAGLFMVGTSTTSQYQTSPDGITWTNRSTQLDISVLNLRTWSNNYLASNATITVVAGLNGTIAYSTDCLAWTVVNIDSDFDNQFQSPNLLHWDGTRFVLSYGTGLIYTSPTGAVWTRTVRGFPVIPNPMRSPSGVILGGTTTSSNYRWAVTDFTDTTPRNIVHPSNVVTDGILRSYVRIK